MFTQQKLGVRTVLYDGYWTFRNLIKILTYLKNYERVATTYECCLKKKITYS